MVLLLYARIISHQRVAIYLLLLQGIDEGVVTSRPNDSPFIPQLDDNNDLDMVCFRKVVNYKFFVLYYHPANLLGAISLNTLIQVILVHIIFFAPAIIAVIFLPPLILAN